MYYNIYKKYVVSVFITIKLFVSHKNFINFIPLERLRISEGLLKSKEREAVLSFQQIKEKEDIREDSVQEEIMK